MKQIFKKNELVPEYLFKQIPKEDSEFATVIFHVDCLVQSTDTSYIIKPLKRLEIRGYLIEILEKNLKIELRGNPFGKGNLLMDARSVEEDDEDFRNMCSFNHIESPTINQFKNSRYYKSVLV